MPMVFLHFDISEEEVINIGAVLLFSVGIELAPNF